MQDMLSIPIEMPKRHWHKSAAPSSDNLAVSSFDQVIARGAKMTQSVSTAALVTPEEMEDHGFPLPSTGYARACLATWDTPPSTAVTSLIALDCEMVELEDFSEGLARVTLVGLEGVLLDLLVKPQMPVRDYRTQFSGVTREMLEGPQAVSFEEAVDRAQHVFNSTPDPIIVGHSLNGDLEVLRLCHPHCIDTTILYPKGGGSLQVKHSLQYLVKTELGLTMDRTSGHDSADDAKAALALTLLKLQFGDNIGEQRQPVAAVPLSYFVRPDLLRGVLENDLPTVPPRKGRLALGFVGGVDVVDSWAHPPGAEYLEGCSMMLGQEGSEQRATSIETSLTLSRSRLVVCVNRQLERLCSERLGLRETVGVDKGGIRSTVDRLRLDARARLLQGLFRADQVVLESRQDVITPATGCVPGEDAERLLRSIRERTDHAAIPDLWVPPVDADELKLVLAEVDKEIAHIALKLEVGDVLLVCSPVGDYARHLSFCRLKHFIEFDSRRLFNQEPAVAGLETDRSMAKLEAEIVGDWRWSQMLQSELERSKSDFQCAFVLSAVKGAGPL
ncbi:MAG: uncharacterized protein KVP18_001392 [Porospora cf. gigantea A]|uniref:uncharacterized protein n=1 Tax=Porospora cf. gigantea A TaxID=2853593 RepID=UPI003559385B|nr:MAG: hypothetical protein KVP18_001392 [Porospora cf. gigantea A]